jgi:hypothetical protein
MKNYFRVSAIFTVAGALILGALGSGLWDLLFKPLLVWIGSFIFNVATLGINSLRDELYTEIATGIFDRSGLYSSGLLTVILATGFFIPAFIMPLVVRSMLRRTTRSFNLIRAAGRASDTVNVRSPKQMVSQLRWLITALIAVAALGVGVTTVSLVRLAFISDGAVYLEQSQRILAPFLALDQRLEISSRAAQMKSKRDFDVLNDDLLRVARLNHVILPQFKPF